MAPASCTHACIHTYLRWVTNATRSGIGHQAFDAWLELLLAATTAYGCISGARVLLSTGAALLLAREEDPAFFLRSLSRDSGAGRGWGGCIRFGWAAVEIACLAGVLLGEYSMFWLYLGRLLVLPQGAGGGRVERSPVSTRMCACMHSVCVRAFACIHVCVHAHAHTHARAHTGAQAAAAGSARCVPSGSLCIRPRVLSAPFPSHDAATLTAKTTLDCGVVAWGVLFSGAVGLIQGPAAII